MVKVELKGIKKVITAFNKIISKANEGKEEVIFSMSNNYLCIHKKIGDSIIIFKLSVEGSLESPFSINFGYLKSIFNEIKHNQKIEIEVDDGYLYIQLNEEESSDDKCIKEYEIININTKMDILNNFKKSKIKATFDSVVFLESIVQSYNILVSAKKDTVDFNSYLYLQNVKNNFILGCLNYTNGLFILQKNRFEGTKEKMSIKINKNSVNCIKKMLTMSSDVNVNMSFYNNFSFIYDENVVVECPFIDDNEVLKNLRKYLVKCKEQFNLNNTMKVKDLNKMLADELKKDKEQDILEIKDKNLSITKKEYKNILNKISDINAYFYDYKDIYLAEYIQNIDNEIEKKYLSFITP